MFSYVRKSRLYGFSFAICMLRSMHVFIFFSFILFSIRSAADAEDALCELGTHKMRANVRIRWIRCYGAHLVPHDKYIWEANEKKAKAKGNKQSVQTDPCDPFGGLWYEIVLSPKIVFPSFFSSFSRVDDFNLQLTSLAPLHIFCCCALITKCRKLQRFSGRPIAGVAITHSTFWWMAVCHWQRYSLFRFGMSLFFFFSSDTWRTRMFRICGREAHTSHECKRQM